MKTALYPGSFDPVTFGHLDLIARGAALFDRLVVGVADNVRKKPAFTVVERVAMLRRHTKKHRNVSVVSFSGLLVEDAAGNGIDVLLRGVRTTFSLHRRAHDYSIALELQSDSQGDQSSVGLAIYPNEFMKPGETPFSLRRPLDYDALKWYR